MTKECYQIGFLAMNFFLLHSLSEDLYIWLHFSTISRNADLCIDFLKDTNLTKEFHFSTILLELYMSPQKRNATQVTKMWLKKYKFRWTPDLILCHV